MSAINRPPLGLQGLLGSKNFGDNPSELARTVQPTLDMLPFMGGTTLRGNRISGGRTTLGLIAQLPVPSDEVWAMIALSCGRAAGFTGGGGSIKVALSIDNTAGPFSGHTQFISESPEETVAGTEWFTHSLMFPTPLWLEPNTDLSAYFTVNTLVNPDSMTLFALYYAMPA